MARRVFLGGVAAGAGSLALGCGDDTSSTRDGGASSRDSGGTSRDGAGNGPPVWTTVPPIVFVQGVPSSISIAAFVIDPEGDELTITLNDVALPAGVTFDAGMKALVYDGTGPVAMTSGHVLTADDGRP